VFHEEFHYVGDVKREDGRSQENRRMEAATTSRSGVGIRFTGDVSGEVISTKSSISGFDRLRV